MSHPDPEQATLGYDSGPLSPAQGQALAGLLTALNPSWGRQDVYENVGAVVAAGMGDPVAVCVAAVLATRSDSDPSIIRFPGSHWDKAHTITACNI